MPPKTPKLSQIRIRTEDLQALDEYRQTPREPMYSVVARIISIMDDANHERPVSKGDDTE